MSQMQIIQQVVALHQAGRLPEAEAGYRHLLQQRPKDPQLWYLLGALLTQRGRFAEAVAPLRKAVSLRDAYPEAWSSLSRCYNELRMYPEAEKAVRKVLRLKPGDMGAQCNLGNVLLTLERYDEAIKVYGAAIEQYPDSAEAVSGLADALQTTGRYREAFDLVSPLLEAGAEHPDLVRAYTDTSVRMKCPEKGLEMALKTLARDDLTDGQRRKLEFSAGKVADRLDRFDDAFNLIEQGNRMDPYFGAEDDHLGMIHRALEWWTPERHASLPDSGVDSELPVFIVGMPRSGTSLTEQVLDSHPQVHGAGELGSIGELVRRLSQETGLPYPQLLDKVSQRRLQRAAKDHLKFLKSLDRKAVRVTDKLPHNFVYLGLIVKLFPKARVVHCKRGAMDTCLSIFFQNFKAPHPFATELTAMGRHYIGYLDLMDHWAKVLGTPIFDATYEDMVADQEGMSRALVEHLGLPWDDACLSFYENKRVVNTASMHQVRNPVYNRSVQRWRRYESHLQPLLEVFNTSGRPVTL